ncbi:MAG: putative glycoside hydrolase [Clostridiaceae bacterium]|nr:putative glycoside hydrolase [Clostridiaceae bacterium]
MLRNRKALVITIVLVVVAALIVVGLNIGKSNSNKHMAGKDGEVENSPTQSIKNTIEPSPVETPSNTAESGAEDEQSTDTKNNGDTIPEKKEVKAKAIYLTGSSAGNKTFLAITINMVNATELNAVVIDVKEDGRVNYKSEVEQVKEIGAFHELYDVDYVIKTLHENDIYVIARIVVFRDNYLARKRADLAVKRPDGSIWKENGSIAWTNPYNSEVWKYNMAIAKEAVEKGFDEIQFDYVRFPTARKSDVNYGENVPSKEEAISGFLAESGKELNDLGVPVSADVFAIICESPGDTEGIGQVLESIGKDIDYISPMIYPSHYANNSKGMMGNGVGQGINGVLFTAPDLKPYEVVYNALLKTKDRISKVEGYRANVRPYLQDFTASYLPEGYYQTYGPEQIRQQIKAVYDAGYEEWILWNATNNYKEAAFLKEE